MATTLPPVVECASRADLEREFCAVISTGRHGNPLSELRAAHDALHQLHDEERGENIHRIHSLVYANRLVAEQVGGQASVYEKRPVNVRERSLKLG